MRLLKSQRNQIYDMIESQDLSPSQFELMELISTVNGEKYTVISYNNTDYLFTIDEALNDFANPQRHSRFIPGHDTYEREEFYGSWEDQLYSFNKWLVLLKREINAPDKWARLADEMSHITYEIGDDQGKFTVEEFEDLQRRFKLLKDEIHKDNLLQEHEDIINKKLDVLLEYAKTMNKFDWKNLFLGTMMGIAIHIGSNPAVSHAFWGLIKVVFSSYILLNY